MHKFAIINPIDMLQKNVIELINRPIEHIMNSGFLPTISEKIPAKKLPIEYPMKVRRVRFSSSGIFRNITERTNNPEIQNSITSKYEKRSCLLNLHIIKENY